MAYLPLSEDGYKAKDDLVRLLPIGDHFFSEMTLGGVYAWTQHERKCLALMALCHDILPGDDPDPEHDEGLRGELEELRGDLMQVLLQLRSELDDEEPFENLYPDDEVPGPAFFDEGEE